MEERKPTLDLWKFAIQYRLNELEQYCRAAEVVLTDHKKELEIYLTLVFPCH